MSLDALRNKILLGSHEEPIETNQRLLIDKILARYPSKFVIYRELMQNSDDAKSSSIQIILKTDNNDEVVRIIFKNNGFAFRDEDWDRLKKIAEGNPDEQKIGAFGVGFYSLFSICENPFVSSGKQAMAFYWRENKIFAKQGSAEGEDEVWTSFLMDMKNPIEPPSVEEFAQFLTSSLAFTENLQDVSVYINDTLVIQLSKKMQYLKSLDITDFHTFSPQMMFHLTSVDITSVQLDVNMSTNSAKHMTEEKSIRFKIASGNLDVKVNDKFSAEMEQIIKKKPPKQTSIQIIFTGFDEYSNNSSDGYIHPVFKDLLSHPEQGIIYIGFPTNQTTGCCSHLAARVIPTMERVSIDFATLTLAKYNNEMLFLAGTLYRVLYEDEMDQISRSYNEKTDSDTKDDENVKLIREKFEKQAAYALTHFTFSPSKPNVKVGEITELQFFSCLKQKLSILSTNGVCSISDVRMPNPETTGFIKTIPVVPKTILEQCETFFKKAKNTMIKELTPQDVLRELKNRTLSEDEIVELLKWWISFYRSNENTNPPEFEDFMQFACIGDRSRSLNKIYYFLNPSIIPPNVDIPAEVLPYNISKKLKDQKLKNHESIKNDDLKKFFGWSELSLVRWAEFIVNKPDLEVNPTFAEEVHKILARGLNNILQNDKIIIRELFENKKCIPTKFWNDDSK